MSENISDNKVATLQQSKAVAWEHAGIREDRYPVDPTFRWVTQDGTIMRPRDMHTGHLYNALRMLWNHTVPRACIIPPFNHQYTINLPRKERMHAVTNLCCELMNRKDLTEGMTNGLRKMYEYLQAKRKSIKR